MYSYMLYQAERVRTAREQREDDIRAGELAAGFRRLWHSLAPGRAGGQRRFRQVSETGTGAARAARSCQPAGQGAIWG